MGMIRVVVILILAVGSVPEAKAQHGLEFGTDLSPWALAGGSVLGYYNGDGYRVGGEMWRMTFPSTLIEMDEKNKDKGWQRKITEGYVLFYDRFLGEGLNSGGFAGVLFSTFSSEMSRDGYSDTATFRSAEVLLRMGYKFTLTERVHLNPWLGAGPLRKVSDEPVSVADETFHEKSYQVLGTVHLTVSLE